MTRTLESYIPEKGFDRPEQAMDAFLAYVADQGLKLYEHQEEAILELFSGASVVLDAPTGSGKSLVALALHFRTFAGLGRTWYTAPIKALVSEKFFDLCRRFGPEHVGLLTGDGAVNRDAPILCATAEILANAALREGSATKADSVVMDEFHYYGDRDRGWAWQVPLLTLPKTQFLLMSGTLGDTAFLREDLAKRSGLPVVAVKGVVRPVPLSFRYEAKYVHEAIGDLVRLGQTPAYLVHFTQGAATEQAAALLSTDHSTKDEKRAIADALRGFGFHSPFGPTLRRLILHGVGLHHAGLLPKYRLLVEKLAQQGKLKLICGTDTLGVGINVPIRAVLFTQLCKFDGEDTTILTVRDFQQIAGRAGRAGFDTEGFVVGLAPAHVVENSRAAAKENKKKGPKAKEPARGYKHWDENTFQRLVSSAPEALVSRFSVDHGRLLAVLRQAEQEGGDARDGIARLHALIDASHSTTKAKAELHAHTDRLVEQLVRAEVLREDDGILELDPALQDDFSLHHALSLFLVEALSALNPESPSYALDVISWVEAILENPRPILSALEHRERGLKVAELKAAGVPFEERQEQIEQVAWPKPLGEQIYAFYNEYAGHHPWVRVDDIRPKGVLREMLETWQSFGEYVRNLGVERYEGVLLRYLTEAYKAILQNVPLDRYTDALDDAVATLRATLAAVDTSLLTEWETLLRGGPTDESQGPPPDISSDPKKFVARVRAELHAVVRALSRRDWDEVVAGLRDGAVPAEIESALSAFHAEHGEVAFDHRARLAKNTTITRVGPHQWRVRQVIWPRAGASTEQYRVDGYEEDASEVGTYAIEGSIDLRDDTAPTGPLITWEGVSE